MPAVGGDAAAGRGALPGGGSAGVGKVRAGRRGGTRPEMAPSIYRRGPVRVFLRELDVVL